MTKVSFQFHTPTSSLFFRSPYFLIRLRHAKSGWKLPAVAWSGEIPRNSSLIVSFVLMYICKCHFMSRWVGEKHVTRIKTGLAFPSLCNLNVRKSRELCLARGCWFYTDVDFMERPARLAQRAFHSVCPRHPRSHRVVIMPRYHHSASEWLTILSTIQWRW
jgi:hypothetical protein